MTQHPIARLPVNETPKKRKLLETLADKYGVEPQVFMDTMAKVAMPAGHNREELISCLIVANEHNLNPLTKEIHFMKSKTGQIQAIVGVDGWVKKMNEHPQFDGFELEYEWGGKEGKELVSCTAKIYRKDRKHPTVVTEFMSECFRPGRDGKKNAWDMTPARMLRHRTLMQGVRYSIGFAGVMDYDEFQAWQDSLRDVTPAADPLAIEIPDDIPEEVDEAQVVDDVNQDANYDNPQLYLDNILEPALDEATTPEEFYTAWTSHEDEHQHRLDSEHQKRAMAMRDRIKKKKKFE